ncbi:MAG: hypothetical protein PHH28_16640 [Desulfuromonadaceae bacterium]|nr:hypothetical protein [Desulfuromonadaceae bacterium]
MPVFPTVRAGLLVSPASHIDKIQPAFLLYLATDFHSRIAYTSYALRAGASPRAKMIITSAVQQAEKARLLTLDRYTKKIKPKKTECP